MRDSSLRSPPSARSRPGADRTARLPGSRFWPRYLAGNVVIAGAIFSAIPYKTPWNLLPFYAGAFALAGVGFAALVNGSRSRVVRAALAAALAVGSIHLGWQAWRASITYAADPRNPYVYAQTVPDAVRMAARIRDLSAIHPDGARMQVSVIAPPSEQWPLPWYSGHAERRLLDGSRRRAGAAGTGHRLFSRAHSWARAGARRSGTCRSISDSGPSCSWPSISNGTVGSLSGGARAVTPELVLVVPCYNEAARLDPRRSSVS